jgi:hypothetical protein
MTVWRLRRQAALPAKLMGLLVLIGGQQIDERGHLVCGKMPPSPIKASLLLTHANAPASSACVAPGAMASATRVSSDRAKDGDDIV